MPLQMEVYEGKYASAGEQEARALHYTRFCESFLTKERGYEVTLVSGTTGDPLQNSVYVTIQQDLFREWSKEPVKDHSSSLVQKIGDTLNVDGLVVVWIKGAKTMGYFGRVDEHYSCQYPAFIQHGFR